MYVSTSVAVHIKGIVPALRRVDQTDRRKSLPRNCLIDKRQEDKFTEQEHRFQVEANMDKVWAGKEGSPSPHEMSR